MLSTPLRSFNDLPPELLPIISGHLPLVYRPSTILSLALTCHRIYEIVAPFLLYNNVHLVDDLALSTLKAFNANAEVVTEEDILIRGNPSPSHCTICVSILTYRYQSPPLPIPGFMLSTNSSMWMGYGISRRLLSILKAIRVE